MIRGIKLSAAVLLAANFIPLVGVIFYGWDIGFVLGVFWVENLVIGAFNIVKIISACALQKRLKDLIFALFFLVHYGLFCAIHGGLLWDLLGLGAIPVADTLLSTDWLLLEVFAEGVGVFAGFVERYQTPFLMAVLALACSHAVRFVEHFLLNGEITQRSASKLMGAPYKQIMVMHAGLILGAIAVDEFGSTLALLSIIVLFKMVVDLRQEFKAHQNLVPTD